MDNKNNANVRRNPFKEVLPLDDLRIAAGLISRRQIRQYWLDHPTPLRPIGRLKFESLRQVATFALPILMIGTGMAMTNNAVSLLVTVPAGLALGVALHRKLTRDIHAMRDKDDTIDRGRYQAVRKLSASTGIPANEITLDMIEKMALDFVDVTTANEAREAAAQAEAHRTTMERINREEAARKSRRTSRNTRATGGAVAAGAVAGSIASMADDDGVLPDHLFTASGPALNPTTGLPMMHDTMGADVDGTAYGSQQF